MKNIRDKSNKNLKDINRLMNTSSTCVNKKNKIHFFVDSGKHNAYNGKKEHSLKNERRCKEW